jgi:hypothetical protein
MINICRSTYIKDSLDQVDYVKKNLKDMVKLTSTASVPTWRSSPNPASACTPSQPPRTSPLCKELSGYLS